MSTIPISAAAASPASNGSRTELFSQHSLAPIELTPVTARGTRRHDADADVRPAAPAQPILPPFCCAPAFRRARCCCRSRSRVIPYIHDLFLITRPGDLNARAKLYMAKPFGLAVRRYPRFLVNSLDTARKLAEPSAAAMRRSLVYRPKVRNVFGVNPAPSDRPRRDEPHFACSASARSSRARTIATPRASSRELRKARLC